MGFEHVPTTETEYTIHNQRVQSAVRRRGPCDLEAKPSEYDTKPIEMSELGYLSFRLPHVYRLGSNTSNNDYDGLRLIIAPDETGTLIMVKQASDCNSDTCSMKSVRGTLTTKPMPNNTTDVITGDKSGLGYVPQGLARSEMMFVRNTDPVELTIITTSKSGGASEATFRATKLDYTCEEYTKNKDLGIISTQIGTLDNISWLTIFKKTDSTATPGNSR
jgi:hypothetical protein